MPRKNKIKHLSVTNAAEKSVASRSAFDSEKRKITMAEESSSVPNAPHKLASFWRRLVRGERVAIVAVVLLLTLGAAGAGLKYLEESAEREKAANANLPNLNKPAPSFLSKVNPFTEPPPPSATPQLSKSYIYAGSRMLAVEDANANAAPPADLAVWRPSTGFWYVLGGTGSAQTTFQWGNGTGNTPDRPVPGDYDGDGKTDFSVFRPSNGTWYIVRSSDGSNLAYTFGQANDKMAQADYDGDGRTDAAVFRGGSWHIQKSSDSTLLSQPFGLADDVPTPADFDGDGKADLAVWRGSDAKFYILRSSSNFTSFQTIQFGASGDVPVVGDYDGDGKADATVWKGAPHYQWHTLYSATGATYGTTLGDPASDIAVQNDYDGDGKTDMAVWRPSTGMWLIQQSANGARSVQWGQNGDTPVPAFYRR